MFIICRNVMKGFPARKLSSLKHPVLCVLLTPLAEEEVRVKKGYMS